MVARINTIAFQGVDVQPIDVQVQISNGLPAFTIVGYILLIVLFFMPMSAKASDNCPLFGSEYIPQDQKYDPENKILNRTLSFVLRIEKGDIGGTVRSLFLNFEAYDQENKKISTMRFGNAWSNGVSREIFSNYWGMYCTFGKDTESDCQDMKPNVGFDVIGINKDLSPADIRSTPDLLIFPGTYGALTYNSFQRPEDWDKYIKFFTTDRIYPDFRGYDFWVRKKCGSRVKEDN